MWKKMNRFILIIFAAVFGYLLLSFHVVYFGNAIKVLKKAKLKSIKSNSKSVEQIEELSAKREKVLLKLQSGDEYPDDNADEEDDRWQ